MHRRNPVISQLPTYPAEALYAKRRELVARGLEVFDFSVGDPREPTDARIRAAFAAGMPEVSQYPTTRGLDEMRAACAAWLARRFGVEVDAAREVLPTSGSKEAVFHAPAAFVDPAAAPRVLFGAPAYPVYERSALLWGARPWIVELRPERGYRLEPWTLDEAALAETAMLWINYPHNPTAACVDRDYLARVAEFCREREIVLCADECYVDMYLDDDVRPPSLLEVAREGVLTFHSLSKRSGMTGYRSGFIAGDPELVDLFAELRPNFGVAASEPVQRASIVAWGDEQHAEARRVCFRQKRDVILAFLERAGIEAEPCRATLYLWVRVPGAEDGAGALAYAERLADAGILVSPAPQLGVDQPYIRLALVPTVEDCERAVARWAAL
ncbi:MAG: aminotransferase class I/II-fold pyridoxal phosphate-dependent enzyme [Myxococcales bacterium]|nr:aminotransferase class I/II-fold pyridoxal phosphate-dependent enzyme [Myxococcales bacterium]